MSEVSHYNVDGLVQKRPNSSALAMGLCLFALTHQYESDMTDDFTGILVFIHLDYARILLLIVSASIRKLLL